MVQPTSVMQEMSAVELPIEREAASIATEYCSANYHRGTGTNDLPFLQFGQMTPIQLPDLRRSVPTIESINVSLAAISQSFDASTINVGLSLDTHEVDASSASNATPTGGHSKSNSTDSSKTSTPTTPETPQKTTPKQEQLMKNINDLCHPKSGGVVAVDQGKVSPSANDGPASATGYDGEHRQIPNLPPQDPSGTTYASHLHAREVVGKTQDVRSVPEDVSGSATTLSEGSSSADSVSETPASRLAKEHAAQQLKDDQLKNDKTTSEVPSPDIEDWDTFPKLRSSSPPDLSLPSQKKQAKSIQKKNLNLSNTDDAATPTELPATPIPPAPFTIKTKKIKGKSKKQDASAFTPNECGIPLGAEQHMVSEWRSPTKQSNIETLPAWTVNPATSTKEDVVPHGQSMGLQPTAPSFYPGLPGPPKGPLSTIHEAQEPSEAAEVVLEQPTPPQEPLPEQQQPSSEHQHASSMPESLAHQEQPPSKLTVTKTPSDEEVPSLSAATTNPPKSKKKTMTLKERKKAAKESKKREIAEKHGKGATSKSKASSSKLQTEAEKSSTKPVEKTSNAENLEPTANVNDKEPMAQNDSAVQDAEENKQEPVARTSSPAEVVHEGLELRKLTTESTVSSRNVSGSTAASSTWGQFLYGSWADQDDKWWEEEGHAEFDRMYAQRNSTPSTSAESSPEPKKQQSPAIIEPANDVSIRDARQSHSLPTIPEESEAFCDQEKTFQDPAVAKSSTKTPLECENLQQKQFRIDPTVTQDQTVYTTSTTSTMTEATDNLNHVFLFPRENSSQPQSIDRPDSPIEESDTEEGGAPIYPCTNLNHVFLFPRDNSTATDQSEQPRSTHARESSTQEHATQGSDTPESLPALLEDFNEDPTDTLVPQPAQVENDKVEITLSDEAITVRLPPSSPIAAPVQQETQEETDDDNRSEVSVEIITERPEQSAPDTMQEQVPATQPHQLTPIAEDPFLEHVEAFNHFDSESTTPFPTLPNHDEHSDAPSPPSETTVQVTNDGLSMFNGSLLVRLSQEEQRSIYDQLKAKFEA